MSNMTLLCNHEVLVSMHKMQLLQVHASHYSQLSRLPMHAAYTLRLHSRIQQVNELVHLRTKLFHDYKPLLQLQNTHKPDAHLGMQA